MQTHQRYLAGLAALVACVALAACGGTEPGALDVACVPQAEVFVDGTSHGTTPVTIDVTAGSHDVRLVRDRFEAFETTVDVGSGSASKIEAVLIGTDPTDTAVIRLLAQASDVEFEEYEDPARTRGRSKEVVARLVWPQKDVRLEGLTSFCIEAGLEYMGDGFVEFKKGRKVLHRVPFSPDYEVTVMAIPAEVRDDLKANDSVTWGITFDDRRKGITTKFKVVKKAQAERKLAKLEKSRHFQRQPDVTQELLKAQVLHNYSLYTESLVQHLMVHQRHPDSAMPYEGIVKSLRRMKDGDETALWRETAGFVLGGGRARRAGGAAGRNPIPQPTPRVEAPRGPDRPDPAVVQPGNQPSGIRPGGTPNPAARLALWSPGKALGPGDQVPSAVPGRPDIEVPDRPGPTEPEAATREAENAGELRSRAEGLTNDFIRVRDEAEDAQQEADDARRQAEEAGHDAADKTAKHERSLEALQEAERAQREDPREENQNALEERQREALEAQAARDDAADAAEAAQHRAAEAEERAAEAHAEARGIEEAAQAARREAEQAGVALPEISERSVQERVKPLLNTALQAKNEAVTAREEAGALQQAADLTGDPELAERAREAGVQAERLEVAADAALTAYRDAGGQEHLDELESAGRGGPTEDTLKSVLKRRVDEVHASEQTAGERLEEAQRLYGENPGNAEFMEAAETAQREYDAAKAELDRVTQQYTQITGEEP